MRRFEWANLGGVAAFGGPGLITGLVWFALLPIVTRLLSPADIGVYGAYRAAYQLAVQIAPLGAAAFIMWNHLKARADTQRIMAASAAVAAALLVAALGTSLTVQEGLLSIGLPLGALSAALVSAWLLNWAQMAESVLQMEQEPLRFLSIRLVESMVFGLGVLALSVVWSDWWVLVGSQTVGLGVAAMVGLLWLRRRQVLSLIPRREDVHSLFRFGREFVPHAVGLWTANYIDRYIIAAFTGVEDAGLYVVAYSVSMVFSAAHEGVARTYAPLVVSSVMGDTSERFASAIVFYRYALWGLFASIALIIPSLWLMLWLVGDDFAGSGRYLPFLIVAQAFAGVSRYMTGYMVAGGLTTMRSKVTFATAIANVVLSVVLVGFAGPVGAAIATAITFLMGAVWSLLVVRQSGLMPSVKGVGGISRIVQIGRRT